MEFSPTSPTPSTATSTPTTTPQRAHVRLSVGQACIYMIFPDRTCIVCHVHDTHIPVLYDVKVPVLDSNDRDRFIYARNVLPNQLRAVDEIYL